MAEVKRGKKWSRCNVYDDRVSKMSGRNREVGSITRKKPIYVLMLT